MTLRFMGGPPVVKGVAEGTVSTSDDWREYPDMGNLRLLWIYFGDPVSGPKVSFIDGMRVVPKEERRSNEDHVLDAVYAGRTAEGSHYHRSDAWRTQIVDRDEQYFYIGAKKHSFGDYYFQPANLWYDDPAGPDGTTQMLVFADRRGGPPITRANRTLSEDELLKQYHRILGAFDPDPEVSVLGDDASVTSGLSATTDDEIPRTGLSASLLDDSKWSRLSDGSTMAALFMADCTSGPALLFSHNTPGAVEAPTGSYGSDLVRLVIKGGCSIGGQTLGPGDFRVTEAGITEPPVVHGDGGSIQIVALSDRRGWCSSGTTKKDGRVAEIAAVLAPFVDSARAFAAN